MMIKKHLMTLVFSFTVAIVTSQSAYAWRCSNGSLMIREFGLSINLGSKPEKKFFIVHRGEIFPNRDQPFLYDSRSECRRAMKEIKRGLKNQEEDEG
jgi:hypothetical protein